MATMRRVEIADSSDAVAVKGVGVAVMIKLLSIDVLVVVAGDEFSDIPRLQLVQGLQLVAPKEPENPAAQKLHIA